MNRNQNKSETFKHLNGFLHVLSEKRLKKTALEPQTPSEYKQKVFKRKSDTKQIN